MTAQEAIEALDALDDDDQEASHIQADRIIEEFLPSDIRDAYNRVKSRIGFWYA